MTTATIIVGTLWLLWGTGLVSAIRLYLRTNHFDFIPLLLILGFAFGLFSIIIPVKTVDTEVELKAQSVIILGEKYIAYENKDSVHLSKTELTPNEVKFVKETDYNFYGGASADKLKIVIK